MIIFLSNLLIVFITLLVVNSVSYMLHIILILWLLYLLFFYENILIILLHSYCISLFYCRWMLIEMLLSNITDDLQELIVILLVLVIFISLSIELFAIIYLLDDNRNVEFFMYILLFMFLMYLLITGGELMFAYLTWESIGLVSFLLISFWYFRFYAIRSGLQALCFNKVGDVILLIGFIYLHICC